MKYAICNENGEHVRETRTIVEGRRGNVNPVIAQRAAARIETGFGVNRNLEQQRQLRREGAIERQMYRATLSAEAQLGRINERPGLSLQERVRLLMQVGGEEAIEAVKLIITGLKGGERAKSRRLGEKFEKQYGAKLATA